MGLSCAGNSPWIGLLILFLIGVCIYIWRYTFFGAFIEEVLRAFFSNSSGQSFDLAHQLLHIESPVGSAWANLGYWEGSRDFHRANILLADKLVEGADLQATDVVLDLGSGCADSSLHWVQKYNVAFVQAINISSLQNHAARLKIDQAGLQNQIQVIEGDCSQVIASSPSMQRNTTVAICLDCIYHFDSRRDCLHQLGKRCLNLRQLVFSDIVLCESINTWWDKQWARLILLLSMVPEANHVSASGLMQELQQENFQNISIRQVDAAVLQGYADYIKEYYKKHKAKASKRQWLRFLLVGYFLRIAMRRGLFHYVLVSASKS